VILINNIKKLLKSKNLKIKDVAPMMNMMPSTLSAKINGHRIFNQVEIDKLLEILNTTYEDVFIKK
jgi:transcriptional regulator with XRE-family HTH domain